jgi:hypothetical protein
MAIRRVERLSLQGCKAARLQATCALVRLERKDGSNIATRGRLRHYLKVAASVQLIKLEL